MKVGKDWQAKTGSKGKVSKYGAEGRKGKSQPGRKGTANKSQRRERQWRAGGKGKDGKGRGEVVFTLHVCNCFRCFNILSLSETPKTGISSNESISTMFRIR